MLKFLHLSDIHFHRQSGSIYDQDTDLRNELVLDAESFVRELGVPDGVLISGDIAFSGQSGEYESAKTWLKTLCEVIAIEPERVWCVPGNHDVDQTRAKTSTTLLSIQTTLRNVASNRPETLAAEISKCMADPYAREPLFQPIAEYNKFAAAFGCSIGPANPYWDHDFQLDDGSILRVRGMNSTLVSNHEDNFQRFVILGEHQIPSRGDGVVYMTMCHHPHGWLRGSTAHTNKWNARVPLQLFGHMHEQALNFQNGAMHLIAGAVQPQREESQWRPRYNWLYVSVEYQGSDRKLKVSIYPRIWNDDKGAFAPDFNSCDGEKFQETEFVLPAWTLTNVSRIAQPTGIGSQSDLCERITVKPSRTLTYRFLGLSHIDRIDIARELRLYSDEDEAVDDAELYKRIFERARERRLLSELWDKVEQRHDDGRHPDNPFADLQES